MAITQIINNLLVKVFSFFSDESKIRNASKHYRILQFFKQKLPFFKPFWDIFTF